MSVEKQFLSRQSVAQFFDVSPSTVDRWVDKGVIPAPLSIGGNPRWSINALLKAVAGVMDKQAGTGAPSTDPDEALEDARNVARQNRKATAGRRHR